MRAIIWQIGLFQRLEGNKEAVCKLCIENCEKKYTFSINNFTTTNLVYHLKSKHKSTEFCEVYLALEKEKENRKIKCEIDLNNQFFQQIEEQTSNNGQETVIVFLDFANFSINCHLVWNVTKRQNKKCLVYKYLGVVNQKDGNNFRIIYGI